MSIKLVILAERKIVVVESAVCRDPRRVDTTRVIDRPVAQYRGPTASAPA